MLWVMLAQTRDAILRARERDYARYGISNERRAVLTVIEANGGSATPVLIARALLRELHSVSELVKRMEKDGLVEKMSTSGRSRAEVRATEAGREAFEQSLRSQTDKRILSALTKAERRRLAALLGKVRARALEDLGIPEWHLYPIQEPPGVGE
jgi:DNA-binding MarR family transcriptional regulator